ncbi:hypothetical protein [Nitrobacter sp. TKz-YC02]|uniref:hypothetical protein n=1 Tax=Nitrobacter sp. TKz-YC02 TaxID=3398704 RepID=UPI003CF51450
MSSTQHGGKRQGAGRPKGSLGKRSIEAIEAVAEEFPDWTPLKHLARVANDATLDAEIRLDAAKAAAPYVHPKPKGIEIDPEALIDLEKRIAKVRAENNVKAFKDGFGLDGLGDRIDRAKARASAKQAAVSLSSSGDIEITATIPVKPAAVIEAEVAPAPQSPPPAPGAPAPAPQAAVAPPPPPADWDVPPRPYSPILPWPERPAFADCEYENFESGLLGSRKS